MASPYCSGWNIIRQSTRILWMPGICSICNRAPRFKRYAQCVTCRKLYQLLYRESLRDLPQQKPCTKCNKEPRMPGQRECAKCDRAYRRKVRPRQRLKMSPEQRMHERTRSITRRLIKSGGLRPQPCRCGETKVQAHHTDYNDPYTVMWVCRQCHRAEHDYKI